MALKTRIVGPWTGSNAEKMQARQMRTVPGWQTRVRRFNIGGRYYLEIWPRGYARGDKRVKRSPVPRPDYVPLPALGYATSPNRSTRRANVSGIVIHETEGAYHGALSWLCNPRSRVSAHLLADETGKTWTQLVSFGSRAWHAASANDHTIGIELSGFVRLPNASSQILAAARVCAYLCHRYGIPPKQGSSEGRNGIVMHKQLGAYGGSSGDPGGFPWASFLALVRREYGVGFAPGLVWGR